MVADFTFTVKKIYVSGSLFLLPKQLWQEGLYSNGRASHRQVNKRLPSHQLPLKTGLGGLRGPDDARPSAPLSTATLVSPSALITESGLCEWM